MEAVKDTDPEIVGAAFTEDGMLLARQKTREAVNVIASRVHPGMVEEDAVAMAQQVLEELGMEHSWHPIRVRFGSNTTKAMRDPSVPNVVLGDNDIFFIDLGPRVDLWEGDGGATFVVGKDAIYARCAKDAETVFHAARRAWNNDKLTGAALYDYANEVARTLGWRLNFDLPGHRVSDFPHAAMYSGKLAHLESTPTPLRWILEIHLCDPDMQFGAFFEDMLLDDSYYA